jgi:hypothetical protein
MAHIHLSAEATRASFDAPAAIDTRTILLARAIGR